MPCSAEGAGVQTSTLIKLSLMPGIIDTYDLNSTVVVAASEMFLGQCWRNLGITQMVQVAIQSNEFSSIFFQVRISFVNQHTYFVSIITPVLTSLLAPALQLCLVHIT